MMEARYSFYKLSLTYIHFYCQASKTRSYLKIFACNLIDLGSVIFDNLILQLAAKYQ